MIPRLAIHSAVSRSSSEIDHRASNEPIITHTAQPSMTAPANGRMRSRSNASRCDGTSSGTARAGRELRTTNGMATTVRAGDHEEGPGDPERPDQQRGDGRAGGEPTDLGGEQPPQVVPDALGVGEDQDAPHGRDGHADADPHHEAPGEVRHEVARCSQHDEAGDVEAHPDQHEAPGVAAIGERGDEDLGEEAGEEAHPEDGTELGRVIP